MPVLIGSKEITTAAITVNKPKFDEITGKMREVPVMCIFRDADTPYAFPHALGRTPTGFRQGPSGRNGGPPGKAYSRDYPLQCDKYNIVLQADAANMWAVIYVH